MPRLHGSFDMLDFDSKAYNAAMRKRILTQFKGGIKAFVMAAVPLVPVDTGMSRGSFRNLGRLLVMSIPISPKSFGKTYYAPDGKRLPKTPQSGASLSTPTTDILKQDGTKITFNFQSDVFHYNLNEFFGMRSNNGVPWGSFTAGRSAFMDYIKQSSVFPDLKKYIFKTTITIGRDGSIKTGKKVRLRKQATTNAD